MLRPPRLADSLSRLIHWDLCRSLVARTLVAGGPSRATLATYSRVWAKLIAALEHPTPPLLTSQDLAAEGTVEDADLLLALWLYYSPLVQEQHH